MDTVWHGQEVRWSRVLNPRGRYELACRTDSRGKGNAGRPGRVLIGTLLVEDRCRARIQLSDDGVQSWLCLAVCRSGARCPTIDLWERILESPVS